MELGQKIKILREKAGLTQEELANEVGVQRNTVWRWENGRANLTTGTLQRLSSVLNTGTLDLMSVNPDEISTNYATKKKSIHEEDTGSLKLTFGQDRVLEIPATQQGYDFFERLLSKGLLGITPEQIPQIHVKEAEFV